VANKTIHINVAISKRKRKQNGSKADSGIYAEKLTL
jgi:hypothetical protein